MPDKPLSYATSDLPGRTGRTLGQWLVLLIVWIVGLAVWTVYIIFIIVILLRVL